MARRRTTRKRSRGRTSRAIPSISLRMPRMPELQQRDLDLIGLGLVALAAFFAFVFYLGWDGGKVGGALGDAFRFLFGGVAYLVPLVMLGAGALLLLGPMLPSIRPFRAGAICVLAALMLGLAGGLFGLGPAQPPRHGFMNPDYFRHHGGVIGEVLYWSAKTLIQRFGAYIAFLFLLAAGVMLLTGASVPRAERARAEHAEAAPEELTPQGNRRSDVTEAADVEYRLPKPTLLQRSKGSARVDVAAQERTSATLVEALSHFGIQSKIVGAVAGPHVTRYELRLEPGTKMSKVSQLKDDLAYALAATEIRILAPIPGKQAVGVEVPNEDRRLVHLGDVFQEAPAGWSPLTVWLGKDIAGKAIGPDPAKPPHILVAGTTGSGKSGAVNAMLSSILLRATPNDVRLVLVDPKQVELNYYESIPHLLTPVVTSPRLAANVLGNLLKEMEQRYGVMSKARARNLVELNRVREREGERPLPYILCVIDELADLMMIAPGEVEDAIIRLAQKSRAVGIHLLLATQRPSADIITGMIKANVPARIAFAVSSQTDSRVILDQNGAESLLGQGDMLFRPASESRPARIQGAFVTEEEIERLTEHWRRQGEPEMHEELLEAVEPADGD